MKKRFFKVFAWTVGLLSFAACSDSDDPVSDADSQLGRTQENQIANYELVIDKDNYIRVEDKAVNYGTAEQPILFPINQKLEVKGDNMKNKIFVLKKEVLEKFVAKWAEVFGLPHETVQERFEVCRNIRHFFSKHEVDLPLFANLCIERGHDMADLKTIVDAAVNSATRQVQNKNVNGLLYQIYVEKKEIPSSRSAYNDFIGMVDGMKDVTDIWVDFTKNDPSKAGGFCGNWAFLNRKDSNPRNYISGSPNRFISKRYELKYSSGIWGAKFYYHLEGYDQCKYIAYKNAEKDIPGYYLPEIIPYADEVWVDGPFHVSQGECTISKPVNASTDPEWPIVKVQGMVHVVYGDCCCFRYHSYLNFIVRGDSGFREI